jgi:hypothetical protein
VFIDATPGWLETLQIWLFTIDSVQMLVSVIHRVAGQTEVSNSCNAALNSAKEKFLKCKFYSYDIDFTFTICRHHLLPPVRQYACQI